MQRIREFVQTTARKIIQHLITSRLEEIPFVIFASFLLTFFITRFYIQLTHKPSFAFLVDNIIINGVHIHHLNFGIIMLVIVGFWSLYDIERTTHRSLAFFYGIGLALTFDEFALWLHLQDNYYAQASYDAILVITGVLLSIVYFPRFWSIMGKGIMLFLRPVIEALKFSKNHRK